MKVKEWVDEGLVRFVDRVRFFKDGDAQKEKELLNIILSAKV